MKLSALKSALENYHKNVGAIRWAMSGAIGKGLNALTGYDFSQSPEIAKLEKYLKAEFATAQVDIDVSLAEFEKAHGELSKKFLASTTESAKLFNCWIAEDARQEEKKAESHQDWSLTQLIQTGENAAALPVLGVKSDANNLLSTVCRLVASKNGDVISFMHFKIKPSHPLYEAMQLRIEPAASAISDSQIVIGTYNVLLLMIVKPYVVYSLPRTGLVDCTLNLEDLYRRTFSITTLNHDTFHAEKSIFLKRLEKTKMSQPIPLGYMNSEGISELPGQSGYNSHRSVLTGNGAGMWNNLPSYKGARTVFGEPEFFEPPEELIDGGFSDSGSTPDDEYSEQESSRGKGFSF